MKKVLFIVAAILTFFQASAQVVTVTGGNKKTFFLSATDPSDCPMYFTNNTGKETVFGYSQVSSDFPFAWSVSLCDNRNCHDKLVLEDSFAAMPKDGKSEFKISIDPNGVADTSTVIYTIYDKANPTVKDTLEFHFVLQWGAGLMESGKISSSVYPNPATEKIYFENILPGTQVNIFASNSILMKTILIGGTETGVNISDLPSGFYFVSYNFNNALVRSNFVKH